VESDRARTARSADNPPRSVAFSLLLSLLAIAFFVRVAWTIVLAAAISLSLNCKSSLPDISPNRPRLSRQFGFFARPRNARFRMRAWTARGRYCDVSRFPLAPWSQTLPFHVYRRRSGRQLPSPRRAETLIRISRFFLYLVPAGVACRLDQSILRLPPPTGVLSCGAPPPLSGRSSLLRPLNRQN